MTATMVYSFGDFAMDADTRRLLLDGEEVHLTPKAFDLLHLLLAERARALSKSELQERIWPSTFVEETNLATLVAEIRRALRDTASQPRFIRTLYGFGYRFVAPVTESTALPSPQQWPHREPEQKLWLIFERRALPIMSGSNVIGRASDAAIRIDAPGMSRHHARIRVADDGATLEDLGSKNGTLLNGTRLTTASPLADGDEIRLGTVSLTFRTSTSETHPTETIQPEETPRSPRGPV